MATSHELCVIGGGNMARAILTRAAQPQAEASGAGAPGVLDAGVVVAEPDEGKRSAFPVAVASAAEALAWVREREQTPGRGQVLLAVKPQVFPEVARELRPLLEQEAPGRTVVSILAGTTSAAIREQLGGGVRVVRVMPNTPAQIGRGMSAVCLGAGAEPGDQAFAMALFESVGRVVEVSESLLDAFTAIAGSGPAYVFYLAEAMLDAATELGFEREQALTIVRETVSGAGELLRASPEPPRALRAMVTSKGGTTAAATGVLDQAGVMDAVMRAAHAARHRGAELGRTLD